MLKKIVGLEIIWEYLHSTHSDFEFDVKEYAIPGKRINAWILCPPNPYCCWLLSQI